MRKTTVAINNVASFEETALLLEKTGIGELFGRRNDALVQLSEATTRLKEAFSSGEKELEPSVHEWLRIYNEIGDNKSSPLRLPIRIDVHPKGARALLPIAYPYDSNGGYVEMLYRHVADALGLGTRPRNYNCRGHVEVRRKGPIPAKHIDKLFTSPEGFEDAGIHIDVTVTYSSDNAQPEPNQRAKPKHHKKRERAAPSMPLSRWEPSQGSAAWKILEYGRKTGTVTFAGLREELSDMPTGTIGSYLVKLTENGYCKKGENRGTYIFERTRLRRLANEKTSEKTPTLPRDKPDKARIEPSESDLLQYVATTEKPTLQGYMDTRRCSYGDAQSLVMRLAEAHRLHVAGNRLTRDAALYRD